MNRYLDYSGSLRSALSPFCPISRGSDHWSAEPRLEGSPTAPTIFTCNRGVTFRNLSFLVVWEWLAEIILFVSWSVPFIGASKGETNHSAACSYLSLIRSFLFSFLILTLSPPRTRLLNNKTFAIKTLPTSSKFSDFSLLLSIFPHPPRFSILQFWHSVFPVLSQLVSQTFLHPLPWPHLHHRS